MHAFWLVLTCDLLEDRRIDDVIIETFALCYSKMAESFENLDDILADWVNEDFEKSLVEAVDSYDKQEKERKSRFSVENDLTKLLEQSHSNATKRNTKWVVRPISCSSRILRALQQNRAWSRLLYLLNITRFSSGWAS